MSRAMIVLAFGLLWGVASGADALPSVAALLDGTPFSSADARTVVAGKIAITPVDANSKRELVVGIACLRPKEAGAAPPFDGSEPMLPAKLVDDFGSIDPKHSARDLEKLHLRGQGEEELRRFVDFEPGIGLNLSVEEAAAFQKLAKVQGGKPSEAQLADTLRRVLSVRVQAYFDQGLAGIAPYVREKGKQAQPRDELRRSLEQGHVMERRFPDFFHFWNRYPKAELPGAEQRYFWIQSMIRDRPAVILGHQVAWRQADVWMMGERHFYISHFFNGGYTVALTIPAQEGMLFAMMTRLWVDGYSGMAGMKRSVGRKLLGKRLRDQALHVKACRQP